MLNLKKGLALVLAAATAFTFAPVSTFAGTGDPATDGLTTTNKIDSGLANITVSHDGTESSDIWLQEHNAISSDNTKINAYRITVTKHRNDDGTYSTGLNLEADFGAADSPEYQVVNNTNSGAATAFPDAVTSKQLTSQDTDSYIVASKPQQKDPSNRFVDMGGAKIRFAADTSVKADTYTVTVAGLGAANENEADHDVTTFTVTVSAANEAFNIKNTSYIVAEDAKFSIPYTIANFSKSSYLRVTTDNKSVARVADSASDYTIGSDPNNISDSSDEIVRLNGFDHVAGTIKIAAGEAGLATFTIEDRKADNSVIGSKTVSVKVTPKNGKLYVTYETPSGTYTYNDDAAFERSKANNTQVARNSVTEAMDNDGNFVDKAVIRKEPDGKIVLSDGSTKLESAMSAAADWQKVYYDLPAATPNGMAYNTAGYNGAILPAAKTLYTNGVKTVQITGSSDAGADVSYALVAPSKFQDKRATNDTTFTVNEDTDNVLGNSIDVVKQTNWTAASGVTTQNEALTSSSYGQNSQVLYTEKAAREYGSIDKNGLVTLKDAKNAPTLYVIVTAKGAAAESGKSATRATSTFIVPVNLQNQQPVSLYVADSKCFAEQWAGDTTNNIHNTLYLSMTDRTTDTLVHKANVSDNYITVTSSDPSVVSVNGWTLTAHKEGSATITVKTSSAPEVSGIANVRLNVVVNKLLSTNVVTAKGVAVNKENPSANVTASSNVKDSSVVFDRDALYTTDSSMPSGYKKIGPTDDHWNDVTVSTTGHVTYQKNDGTVYVRAYASGTDKYNPSTYVYVPVNYGQKVVTTDLNVDQTPITLAVKETKRITASVASGASITYTSQDPTVATVAADGTVTAVKSGTTYVTVTGVAADGTTAESAVVAVIVKGNATITDDTVKKPSKVTGVKVTNLKGGKVKVTWTKQNQKNIKYYVKKTVGKKSAGKSVGSNKTTLSVKKGATVKVKVKAYIYNAEGTKLVGSYSKTITKKTDKK